MLSSNSPETAAGNLTVAAVFVISLFFKISFHHLLSRIISKRHDFETACRSFLYSFLHDKSDRILQNASYFFFLVFFLLLFSFISFLKSLTQALSPSYPSPSSICSPTASNAYYPLAAGRLSRSRLRVEERNRNCNLSD